MDTAMQSIIAAQESCDDIKNQLLSHQLHVKENIDRNVVSTSIDHVIDIGNNVVKLIKSIETLRNTIIECESIVGNIIDIQKTNLIEETKRLNESRSGGTKKELWSDVVDDPNSVPAWDVKKPTITNQYSVPEQSNVRPQTTSSANVAPVTFSVFNKNDNGTTWCRMTVPVISYKIHPEGDMSIKLITVMNDTELAQLPAGIMVYHAGKKIPKVMMTTGRSCAPAVPLGCRMYNTEENTVYKYSRLNLHAKTTNGPGDDQFYIDEALSRLTNLDEDYSRNFRIALKGPDKRWAGYRVFKMDNFGDTKFLKEQFSKIKIEDSIDLYQYALHMMLVAILQYRHV